MRPLAEGVVAPAGNTAPVVDAVYRDIINIGRHNVPMVDTDVHLGNGLTLERALEKSRRDGLEYGIALPPAKDDAEAAAWASKMQHEPAFLAFYAVGEGWTKNFSQRTVKMFDYVTRDATALGGESTADAQMFMERLVAQTVEMLEQEPIDIWAKPTYLPAQFAGQAEALWTDERMKKVIEAAARNQVAIEMNDRYRLPSVKFVQMAKDAGCKVCFGSGNSDAASLKRCEYGLKMVEECRLDWHNFFVRGGWGPRAVERKGSALLG